MEGGTSEMKYRAEWIDGAYYEFEAANDKFAAIMVESLRKTKLVSLVRIIIGGSDV